MVWKVAFLNLSKRNAISRSLSKYDAYHAENVETYIEKVSKADKESVR